MLGFLPYSQADANTQIRSAEPIGPIGPVNFLSSLVERVIHELLESLSLSKIGFIF